MMRPDPMSPLRVEELAPGVDLGHYEIVDKISQGGMGIVFKANEPTLNRLVALKVLFSRYASDAQYVRSFQEEAQLVASLRHPNIIPIYYIGQVGEVVFYSMAYIPNPSMEEWIQKGHRFDLREVKWFLSHACSALECATKAGLIHLDIKPSNFLMDQNGTLLLTDFGLAKSITGSKGVIDQELYGTPSYVAPERILERTLDHRTDIYSLGATLFHFVVGEPAYDSEKIEEILSAHIKEKFPEEKAVAAGVPQPLIDLLRKMMEKDPARRFQSYSEILSAVSSLENFHYKPAIPLSLKEMEYSVPEPYAAIQTFSGLLWAGKFSRQGVEAWLNADPDRDWSSSLTPSMAMIPALGETLSLGKVEGLTLISEFSQVVGVPLSNDLVVMTQLPGGDIAEIQRQFEEIILEGKVS